MARTDGFKGIMSLPVYLADMKSIRKFYCRESIRLEFEKKRMLGEELNFFSKFGM
jgi:hypothetical protein